jgi:prepilin-type N-terminal cleavage/methylation domain-containing protein
MNNKAFTLIEMVVAVAVFALVVGAASVTFVSSLKAQRQSLASQELLDQTSYLAEYMSRAIRMARKDMTGTCTGTARLNYAFLNQCLKFRNYKNECQQFCLDDNRLKNEAGVYLTSPNLKVVDFNVSLSGETQTDLLQPKVSITLSIEGREQSNIQIQTNISQRNLDVRR